MSNRRCFFVRSVRDDVDLGDLNEYGEPVFLLDGLNIWQPKVAIDQIIDALNEHDFEPARDYIVLTGLSTQLVLYGLAVSSLMQSGELENDHSWTALVYRARERRYDPIAIPI